MTTRTKSKTTMTKSKTKNPRKVRLLVSMGDDLLVFETGSQHTITATDVRRGMDAFNYALHAGLVGADQKGCKQDDPNIAKAN